MSFGFRKAEEGNMECSYRELKTKCVINVVDGKNLGRVCDIVFTFPEGRVFGIVVPGSCGVHLFHRNDIFISLRNIVKIGADVILVDLKGLKPSGKSEKRMEGSMESRRDYGEYE